MSDSYGPVSTPEPEAAFERMLRLAARDSRSRALVAAVLERSGLEADERAAILRDFLALARDPRQD